MSRAQDHDTKKKRRRPWLLFWIWSCPCLRRPEVFRRAVAWRRLRQARQGRRGLLAALQSWLWPASPVQRGLRLGVALALIATLVLAPTLIPQRDRGRLNLFRGGPGASGGADGSEGGDADRAGPLAILDRLAGPAGGRQAQAAAQEQSGGDQVAAQQQAAAQQIAEESVAAALTVAADQVIPLSDLPEEPPQPDMDLALNETALGESVTDGLPSLMDGAAVQQTDPTVDVDPIVEVVPGDGDGDGDGGDVVPPVPPVSDVVVVPITQPITSPTDPFTLPSQPSDGAGDGADATPVALVPEPMTWVMMILGFGGVGCLLRQRRAARNSPAAP
jgi:hypothetical protein